MVYDFVWSDIGFDALLDAEMLEFVEDKVWILPSDESLAEQKLAFDLLDMASWGEGLSVSVFLVALYAGCLTGGAPGMLGVALGCGEKRRRKKKGIIEKKGQQAGLRSLPFEIGWIRTSSHSVGLNRRHLP